MRIPRSTHKWILICLCAVLLSSLLGSTFVLAQGPNLLPNPGFERPYVASIPGKENCAIAAPWVAWYREGTREEVTQGYRFAPEYKAAFRADYPGNRVRNGELAQQWFHSYGNFEAGVLQQVSNISVGAKLHFEIWILTWSCDKEPRGNCGGATSGDPSPMHVRVGIDPTGGGDPFSPAIIWSEEQNAYDSWHHFQVEAVAQKTTVTAYVYSYPTYRSQDNNVYVDDASLVVVAPPAAPTRKPTSTPAPTAVPTQTAVPTDTPIPVLLPTNTLVPTIAPTTAPTTAPKPCPTCPPGVIPTPVTPSLMQQLTLGPALLFVLALAIVAFIAGFLIGKPGRGAR